MILRKKYDVLKEGEIKFLIPQQTKKITKKQTVFYNPVMTLNRDLSVLICDALNIKTAILPLAATGIRALRLLKETKIKEIYLNDISKDAIKIIKKNIKLNKKELKSKKINIYNEDANEFLLKTKGAEYIDLDPFGSPNAFLNNAILRSSRNGILSVTATDTAALTGTYKNTCMRKYWAIPMKNEYMHEIGLRILIRKIQLIGAQFEKALIPIFSYYREHYFKIFFLVKKGKLECDKIIKLHKFVDFNKRGEIVSNGNNSFGPIWTGDLFDIKILDIVKINSGISEETKKFINLIKKEANISGYHINLHSIAKRNNIKIPKTDKIISEIKKKGSLASRTHFNPYGIKTDLPFEELIKLIKSITN